MAGPTTNDWWEMDMPLRRLFSKTDQKEITMADAADTERIDVGKLLDSDEPARNDDGKRLPCSQCRGTGKVLTMNDILREALSLLPTDNPAAMDGFVQEFYRRLIDADQTKPPRDRLAPLFPADLVSADQTALDSAGKQQRDKLLNALVTALGDYDPDHPDSDAMRHLKATLAQAGRSHAAFMRPDGSVRGAEEEEYLAVEQILLGLLRETLGQAMRPEHEWAIHRAYRHAMRRMLAAAEDAAPFSRAARYARTAAK